MNSAPVKSHEEFPRTSLPFQTISIVLVLHKIEICGGPKRFYILYVVKFYGETFHISLHSGLLVVVVEPAEEESVEAHMGEEVGLLPRVAERVDLPGHHRPPALSERLVQKLN